MGFGIFACTMKNEDFQELLHCDYIDTFFVGTGALYLGTNTTYAVSQKMVKEQFEQIREFKKHCFVNYFDLVFKHGVVQKMVDVGESFVSIPKSNLVEGWRDNLVKFHDALILNNHYDCIDGLYIDEPFLAGISPDDFEISTKAISEIFAGKRIFCCFSVADVAPDIWTTYGVEQVTAKSGQYLTDVAFDMYHKFDWKYEYITNQMKERLGNRNDLKIWHIPCTMNYRGDKDEQHCIDHLNGCYDLLMREEPQNRGGLMCYTYYTIPSEIEALGNIGLDNLRGQSGTNWKRLWEYIEKYGRELSNTKE